MIIDDFRGEHLFLSNFYLVDVPLDGVTYPTVEHAFQAAKTLDAVDRERVRWVGPPTRAKRLGRALVLRPDWERVHRYTVMQQLLAAKFARRDLADKLLATGDAVLVEGNTWHDNVWGDCQCGGARCEARGCNLLGWMLMSLRDELRLRRTLDAEIGDELG